MKTGMNLTELRDEIARIEREKADYTAPSRRLSMELHTPVFGEEGAENDSPPIPVIDMEGVRTFGIKDHAHAQLADKLGIPKRYYDKMRDETPELLRTNVNHWFQTAPEDEVRLVRTLDGDVRAFLTNAYRPIDNIVVAKAAVPALADMEVRVMSCQVTERRLYLQAVLPKLEGEIRVGEVVQAGVVISNSEVGCGAFNIQTMIYTLACTNGMIRSSLLNKYHVGRRFGDAESAGMITFADDTRKAENEALTLQTRDLVQQALSEAHFQGELKQLQVAAGMELPAASSVPIIEEVTRRIDLSKDEQKDVLGRFIEAGDFTKLGIANAVTNLANDVDSYDRAVDLEAAGSKVIDIPDGEWSKLMRLAA